MNLDQAGFEVLTPTECLRLLADANRGRVAINVGALPTILPVRFVLDVNRIVFTVGVGTTLARATDGNVVAFEADDTGLEDEWSVSLIGVANHLTDPAEVARATVMPLPRWSKNLPPVFVAIPAEHVSGRRASGSTLAAN
jgi:nitroimidazol reductase NimA-like FMN-containing flavoprotein (pyridoxamine 5'-phosphate oxidase superfamily)